MADQDHMGKQFVPYPADVGRCGIGACDNPVMKYPKGHVPTHSAFCKGCHKAIYEGPSR